MGTSMGAVVIFFAEYITKCFITYYGSPSAIILFIVLGFSLIVYGSITGKIFFQKLELLCADYSAATYRVMRLIAAAAMLLVLYLALYVFPIIEF